MINIPAQEKQKLL